MFDEVWKQLGAGFLLALGSFIPWVLGRYRDRRSHEQEKDELRAQTRQAIDVAGDAIALVGRYLITESPGDNRLKSKYEQLDKEYEALFNAYRRPGEAKK